MRSVLLDTNLLCLLVIGRVGEEQIERHKRLSRYDRAAFALLKETLNQFDQLVLCPHVLAECSNLVRQPDQSLQLAAANELAVIIGITKEQHLPAVTAVADKDYRRLGLTDAVLLQLATPGYILLSDDLDLYLVASRRGIMAVNFNHLREGATLEGLGVG